MPRSPATSRSTRVPFPFILGLLLLLGITSCHDADLGIAPQLSGAKPQFGVQASPGVIPDRFIVTFQPGVADPQALAEALANANRGRVLYTYTRVLKGFALSVPAAALEGIRHNPNVKAIEPDQVIALDDTQAGATWGIDRIDQRTLPLNTTYSYETSAAGVTAYVFDTGIRYDHAEFEGRARLGYDAFGGDGSDCRGHGTHVAGTIGGKTWGVAKKVSLVSVRILDCTGYGSYAGMIAGMDWVVNHNQGPAVANFSLGGSVSSAMNSALTNMINGGIQAAVSAGNDAGDACTKSPASAAAAVTVGATSRSDTRSSYSNYGSCVDVFAPGDGIISASYASTTGSASMSGTSMASPHAAGVLALLRAQYPALNAAGLRDLLVANATQNVVLYANSANAHLLHSLTGGAAPPPQPPTEPDPPPPVLTVPSAPSNAVAGLAGKNVKVSWRDNSTNEDSFVIERSDDAGGSLSVTVAANTTSYNDGNPPKGLTYTYRVKAQNGAGSSAYATSGPVTVSTGRVKK